MILVGLLQPVLYILLFAPLLSPLTGQIGTSNHLTLFIPGMLVQISIFGAAFAGYSLIGEWRDGVIDSERVTPARGTSLLLGRVARDLLQLGVQLVVLVVLGYVLGMRASFGGVLFGIIITLILGAACSAASNALALTSKDERALGSVINTLMMPIILLSGILLPMSLGPRWLQTISDIIPIKHVVDGVRACFNGDFGTPDLYWGIGWVLVLAALAISWGAVAFRRES